MEPVAAAVPAGLHALDLAPVNSKIVVTEEGAMLATPQGVTVLDDADTASRLPDGARIRKTADGYIADQIGDNATPALVTTTADDAIDRFRFHFHGQ